MAYDLYPAVDENFDFPPNIRSAIASSDEVGLAIDTATEAATTAISSGGRLGPGQVMTLEDLTLDPSLYDSGFYAAGNEAIGRPFDDGAYTVTLNRYATDTAASMIAIGLNNTGAGRTFVKSSSGGTWGVWKEVGGLVGGESDLVVDASDYVVADGVTDVGPGIQAMVDKAAEAGQHGGILWFPSGEFFWDTQVVMNDGSADKWRGWLIQGAGRSTRFLLGPGLEGSYAIHVNSAGTNLPGPGKLEVRDVSVWGDTATWDTRPGPSKRSFIRTEDTSVRVINVMFSAVFRGVASYGYTDLMVLDRIIFRWSYPDGCFYYGRSNGDGCLISNVTMSPHGYTIADLENRQGVSITDCVSGSFKLHRCLVYIRNHHMDSHPPGPHDAFYFSQCNVVMESCWMSGSDKRKYIVIDDGPGSPVYGNYDFRNLWFARMNGSDIDVGTSVGFNPEIYIENIHPQTQVRISNCNGHYVESGDPSRRWGPFLLGSSDNQVTSAFNENPSAIMGETVLINSGKGWEFREGGHASNRRSLESQTSRPGLSIALSSVYAGYLNYNANRRYEVAAIQSDSRAMTSHISVAAEVRPTTSIEQDKAVSLSISVNAYPCFVRVWRKVGTNPQDWVDVPVNSGEVDLYDTGTMLSGIPWNVGGGVPTKPGSTQADNTTYDGEIMSGRATVHGSGAPSGGSWTIGDRILNTSASSESGWRCTSSGSPGTWSAF